jgi:hypothetical protein
LGFPELDTLENYSFTAPEAGQYISLPVADGRTGNEDKIVPAV